MPQDVAEHLPPHLKLDLAAGMTMAEGVAPEERCPDTRRVRVLDEHMANGGRAAERPVGGAGGDEDGTRGGMARGDHGGGTPRARAPRPGAAGAPSARPSSGGRSVRSRHAVVTQ